MLVSLRKQYVGRASKRFVQSNDVEMENLD